MSTHKGLHIHELKEGTMYQDRLSGQTVLVQRIRFFETGPIVSAKRSGPQGDEVIEISDRQLVPLEDGPVPEDRYYFVSYWERAVHPHSDPAWQPCQLLSCIHPLHVATGWLVVERATGEVTQRRLAGWQEITREEYHQYVKPLND